MANPPSPWIARFGGLVPRGARVLDVAAGGGRHARWFLDHGHPVTMIDKDVSSLADLKGDPRVEIIEADLEDGSPWPLGGQIFGGIVVANYLYRPLLPSLIATVAPGGLLLYETFAVGNEKYGRPSNPDFLLKPGELLDVVKDYLEVIAYQHGLVEGPAVKQFIAATAGLASSLKLPR
jgi:SAM-dependent methyltransferase